MAAALLPMNTHGLSGCLCAALKTLPLVEMLRTTQPVFTVPEIPTRGNVGCFTGKDAQ